jgi:hypothetical protein
MEIKDSYTIYKVSCDYIDNLRINGNQNLRMKRPDLNSILGYEWTGGDLNPRPPECKSGVHTN